MLFSETLQVIQSPIFQENLVSNKGAKGPKIPRKWTLSIIKQNCDITLFLQMLLDDKASSWLTFGGSRMSEKNLGQNGGAPPLRELNVISVWIRFA